MRKWAILAGLLMVSAAVPRFTTPAFAAHVLITQDEAKLPPPKGAFAVDRRGVTRGPKISLVGDTAPLHSPIHLQLKFESFGGAKIDEDSVKVTYLRTPNVDLTARIKPFVQMTGIDVPDAELPVGDHMVRVDVKDSDGRPGSASFTLQVAP
jgi:hypothetical protein